MHLFELPEDVLLSITDEVDGSTDLLSLCRTSKTLLRITLGVLYRFNIQQQGSSALLWAASKDEITVIQALLGYGADINVKDDEGWSTVSLAAQNGNSRAVELLLMQDNLDLWSYDHRFTGFDRPRYTKPQGPAIFLWSTCYSMTSTSM
ncbi:ankyrin repeat domain-containing protein [Aspergillus melleus]|uniref:ankyrin repeat domain-containing protein n=1 Tax=Aspergillus melleus TaxID=138277 RepID=UPI001E8EA492|nr:uncharacterized protein LDX57_007772 [Aspergillus melleus]KAH8430102.1 hypothetical protein LDX57_007772 [Aspergillus melleus]